jgi:hypothetical protein
MTGCALLVSGCGGIPWRYDVADGIRAAGQQRRRAAVYFCTGSSSECREMDFQVFRDPKVRELLREFIPVRQDLYLNRKMAEQLEVKEVPTFVVVRPDGSVAGRQGGKFTPESLRIFLIKNRHN